MHQNPEETSLDAEEQLGRDWAMFQSVEAGASDRLVRCWETTRPVVVVGRSSRIDADVVLDACRDDGVPVVRRFSGGGAVVLGPGCLNYAVALSLVSRPELARRPGELSVHPGTNRGRARHPRSLGCRGDGSRSGAAEGVRKRPAARAPRAVAPRHAAVRLRCRPGVPLLERASPAAGLPRGPPSRRVSRQPAAFGRGPSDAAGGGVGRASFMAHPVPGCAGTGHMHNGADVPDRFSSPV